MAKRTDTDKLKKIAVHNPNNLPVMGYGDIVELQGKFKTMSQPELNKMKRSVLTHGVFLPKFIWKNKGTNYCIDGHQTLRTLKSLEDDGYKIPPIPVVEVPAKNKEDAIKKLLVINSQYGRQSKKGLKNLLEENDIVLGEDIYKLDIPIVFEYHDRPEVEFSEELLEHHNYLVFYFDNDMDWNNAKTLFGIKEVQVKSPSMRQYGLGRVAKGRVLLEMLADGDGG